MMPVYQLSLKAQTIVEQEKLRTIGESNILPVVEEKVFIFKRCGFSPPPPPPPSPLGWYEIVRCPLSPFHSAARA